MDEPPALLKSRIPRKTILVDNCNFKFTDDSEFRIYDAHCPLRKGIICYFRDDTIFEHNIHSSGKHEPRTIVPKHPSRELSKISFVPIKGNRILLFTQYSARKWSNGQAPEYLHLSIHEIRSDHRVGPALWSFNNSEVDGDFNILDLELIKSTENELGITFWRQFDDHLKLFDISTTETDPLYGFPLIESGRIGVDLKYKKSGWVRDGNPVTLSPDTRILLNVHIKDGEQDKMIDIHRLDPGGTNFSFVTCLSIPATETSLTIQPQSFAFSADGSKFAMALDYGGVLVWDIRSKVPLWTFTELPRPRIGRWPRRSLQFSGGNLGKEILVFVEHKKVPGLAIIHVIDAMLFGTEEMLVLKYSGNYFLNTLFFDPDGGTLYAELDGTLYKWDLQKKEPGPEWWIGEE